MKKILLTIVCFSLFFSALNAQDKDTEKGWDVSAGPMVGVPIRYLHLFHSFGVGADVALLKYLNEKWGAGARVNYLHFFGKSTDQSFGNTGSHYDAANMFNLLTEVNYLLTYNLMIAVNLGLGVNSISGNTDVTLARMASLSYKLRMARMITLALIFNQTNYQKFFGLRANISLGE